MDDIKERIIGFTLNKDGKAVNIIGWKKSTPKTRRGRPTQDRQPKYLPKPASLYWIRELRKLFRKW